MKLSARQSRAVLAVARAHDWQPALSQLPWIYFTYKTHGDDCHTRMRLSEVVREYDQLKRQNTRADTGRMHA